MFLSLVLIGAVIFFPYNQYAGDLKSLLEKEAKNRGVVLEIEKLDFGFPAKINASGIAALLPQGKIQIPLWVNSVDIVPEIWPLLSRKVIATLSGKAYEGDLAGALDFNAAEGKGSVKLSAKHLELEKHPLFRTYSARGIGAFNFESGLNLIAAAPGQAVLLQPVGAKFDLSVEQGNIEENKSFGPLFLIPEISDFTLQTNLEQRDQTINVKTFKIGSSLGKVDATGTIHLTGRGAFDSARVTGTIELTEAGFRAYGPQLSMLGGTQQPVYNWSCAIDLKAGGFPAVKMIPN
jgi:type II secretion system protein N